MERLRDQFSVIDRLRYLWWRYNRRETPFIGRISKQTLLTIRPPPASDPEVAHEIFVGRVYRPPRELPRVPRRIVDAGANVGYSCLYWAAQYPGCSIIAFEPVPLHIRLIREQLTKNPLAKVDLHPAAACAHEGSIRLADSENHTHVVSAEHGTGPIAPAEDFFQQVGSEPIDILKIDIEGGEYELLADSRFSSLNVAAIVMEWHKTAEHPNGREYCLRRLSELGYETVETVPGEQYGMMWGFAKARRSDDIRDV